MAAKDDYLMDTLIDMGLITQEQVDEASGEVTDTHGVIDVLVAKGELFEAVSYTHLTLPTKRIV